MNDLHNIPHQIDFLNEEITPKVELVAILNEHSSHIEHLKEEKQNLTRWHFDNFDKALKVMETVSKESELTYRWICLQANSLFIQHGFFNED